MKKVKAGIIGCGKVSHTHAKILLTSERAELVAVCDMVADRGKAFAAQHGVRHFINMQRLLKEVEMVIICTPHPFHAEPAIRAAEAGVHVLVEKPLASSLQDCDAMISASRKAEVKLGTVFQRRWYAPVRRMKDAIESGKIGRPILGSATVLGWRDQAYYSADPWRGTWKSEGGGVLVNQAPHQLDLLQWFMGPIRELSGYWTNSNHPYIEVEDTAVATLRFASGALGTVLVSNSQKPGLYAKVHIHGQNGASIGVQTDGGAMFIAGMSEILDPPVNDMWSIPGEEHNQEEWRAQDSESFKAVDAMQYYHSLQVADFLDAVLENREPAVNGEEGRKTVELFTAIYRSQRDGRPVTFPLHPEYGKVDFDGRLS